MFDFNHKQGDSIICDRTLGSASAHPQFMHNCLPNEEQIENPKKFKDFSKKNWCMNEKIAIKAKNSIE